MAAALVRASQAGVLTNVKALINDGTDVIESDVVMLMCHM